MWTTAAISSPIANTAASEIRQIMRHWLAMIRSSSLVGARRAGGNVRAVVGVAWRREGEIDAEQEQAMMTLAAQLP